MRLAKASAVAGAAALLISAMAAMPTAQAQQDADKKVAGGGITVKGWQGRVDSGNRQNLTITDSKLAPEGQAMRLMTGAADAPVKQEVVLRVAGDKVECTINGTSVWSAPKADVTGAGKLDSTDGITGIRVSHNSDALVSNFAVGK